jgi:predicted signal transduction protein with EAL and GGDEF domain
MQFDDRGNQTKAETESFRTPAFVRTVKAKAKRDLCRNVVSMAHRLGISVLAEGVQAAEDVRVLTKMQCDGAQGLLFAHAMERAQFAKTLSARAVEQWSEPAFNTEVGSLNSKDRL